jgi:hypothetical protein
MDKYFRLLPIKGEIIDRVQNVATKKANNNNIYSLKSEGTKYYLKCVKVPATSPY